MEGKIIPYIDDKYTVSPKYISGKLICQYSDPYFILNKAYFDIKWDCPETLDLMIKFLGKTGY